MIRSGSLFMLMLAVAVCVGCGGGRPSGKYGNFAKAESVDLVKDAAGQLIALYPPAKTKMKLIQPIDDPFGYSLVEELRNNGYAIQEYSKPAAAKVKSVMDDVVFDNAPGYDLGYVIDDFYPKDKELRVTIFIGQEALSRMYLVNEGSSGKTYTPLGVWSRRS